MLTTPKSRVCCTCRVEKSLECFNRSSKGTYGRQSCCKTCQKTYQERHKEQLKEYHKVRRREDPKRYQEYVRKYRETPLGILNAYSAGAKKRGLVFDLTLEDISKHFLGKPCHYCGAVANPCGIDRVDNSLGYTLSNSVPCCKICNLMKYKYTAEAFIQKCRQIASRWCS